MPALENPALELFAHEYANGATLSRAASLAKINAKTRTHDLLKRPDVQTRIRELNAHQLANINVNAERVKRELARIAFADVRDLYDNEGNLIPPHLMDDDTAATISSIDVEVRWEGRGDAAVPVTTKKIRRTDKMAALALLARHFKVVGDESDGVNALASALADRLKSARRRVEQMPTDVEDAQIIEPVRLPHVVDTSAAPDPPHEGEHDERLW
jgi:phage terminase small subunit